MLQLNPKHHNLVAAVGAESDHRGQTLLRTVGLGHPDRHGPKAVADRDQRQSVHDCQQQGGQQPQVQVDRRRHDYS